MNRTILEARGNALVMQERARQLVSEAAVIAVKEAEVNPDEMGRQARFNALAEEIEAQGAEIFPDTVITPLVAITEGLPEGIEKVELHMAMHTVTGPKAQLLTSKKHRFSPRDDMGQWRDIAAIVTYYPVGATQPTEDVTWVYDYARGPEVPSCDPAGLDQVEGTLELYNNPTLLEVEDPNQLSLLN
jgi:hypothetical protein